MKTQHLLMLACLLLSQIGQLWAQSDAEKENLKGQIKEVTEYIIADGDKKTLNRKAYFSSKGALNEEQIYHPEGNVRIVSSYDEERRLVAKKHFNPMNSLIEEWQWKYNGKGQAVERCQFRLIDGKMQQARVFECKYNSKGQLETEKEFDSKKKLLGTFTFEYSTDGRLDKLTVVVGWLKFFYNDKGQVIETKFYTEDGEYNAQKKWAFDEQGNQVEYVEVQADDTEPHSVEKDVYEYDPQGNWVRRQTTYLNGKVRTMTRELVYHEQ